jgi:hypothetical protein
VTASASDIKHALGLVRDENIGHPVVAMVVVVLRGGRAPISSVDLLSGLISIFGQSLVDWTMAVLVLTAASAVAWFIGADFHESSRVLTGGRLSRFLARTLISCERSMDQRTRWAMNECRERLNIGIHARPFQRLHRVVPILDADIFDYVDGHEHVLAKMATRREVGYRAPRYELVDAQRLL